MFRERVKARNRDSGGASLVLILWVLDVAQWPGRRVACMLSDYVVGDPSVFSFGGPYNIAATINKFTAIVEPMKSFSLVVASLWIVALLR